MRMAVNLPDRGPTRLSATSSGWKTAFFRITTLCRPVSKNDSQTVYPAWRVIRGAKRSPRRQTTFQQPEVDPESKPVPSNLPKIQTTLKPNADWQNLM